MDFELSDEQRAFAETARIVAREEWLLQAPAGMSQEFLVEALQRAPALGFAAIYVGDEFGGSGSAGSMPRSSSRSSLRLACRRPRICLSTIWQRG